MRYNIEIRFEDDYMVVTSRDLPGLLLASKDYNAVIEDIPKAVEGLLLLNRNRKVKTTCIVLVGQVGVEPTQKLIG